MIRKLSLLLGFVMLLLIFPACAEESQVDVTVRQGEAWLIPTGRRGDYTIADPAVAEVREAYIIGLKPGRTEITVSGAQATRFRVLVLFNADYDPAADPLAALSASPVSEDAVHPAVVSAFDALETPATADEGEDDDDEPATGEPAAPAPTQTPSPAPTQAPAVTDGPAEQPAPAESDAPRQEAQDTSPAVQYYDRSEVPAIINQVIDFGISEWRDAANKTWSRAGSKNKYSFWQCGKGSKCNIGWCGAFLGYLFDNTGIPMDEPTKSVPHDSGEPYSVRAAGVGKINKGFENMNRLTAIPKPGYLVVYGEPRGYGYKHIGMVTDVDDLGDGLYLLKTVEGNMSNRIKRYCYLYDSTAPAKVKNTKPCPAEYVRDDGEINDYEHIKTWGITTFCMTWF